MIKMRAQLIDAVCWIWKSLPVGYIRNLYMSIPCGLHSVTVAKDFLLSTDTFSINAKNVLFVADFCRKF